VNPEVKCKVTFIGSFFDPPKAKEAALAQIESGVDVIYAERFGVIEAAKEKGILAISNMSDQSSLAPETVITGPVWDMWPTINAAIRQVQAGAYTAADFGTFSFMAKGGAKLAPLHEWETKLPADVLQLVKDKEAAIMAGEFRVPVNESTPVSE
jgi:basic membrane lipoprotein Med (substrate-binding protein (PBP1-ABC) superfamily)